MRTRGWHSYQCCDFGVGGGTLPMPCSLKGVGYGGGILPWHGSPPPPPRSVNGAGPVQRICLCAGGGRKERRSDAWTIHAKLHCPFPHFLPHDPLHTHHLHPIFWAGSLCMHCEQYACSSMCCPYITSKEPWYRARYSGRFPRTPRGQSMCPSARFTPSNTEPSKIVSVAVLLVSPPSITGCMSMCVRASQPRFQRSVMCGPSPIACKRSLRYSSWTPASQWHRAPGLPTPLIPPLPTPGYTLVHARAHAHAPTHATAPANCPRRQTKNMFLSIFSAYRRWLVGIWRLQMGLHK